MNAMLSPETPRDAARRLSAGVIRDGYKPVALHRYNNIDGMPWCYRIRCKHPNGDKWIRPMRHDGARYVIGEPATPANGKPLYQPPYPLIESDPVVIVEGEPCADALARRGITATTSGAADSANAADWTPLQGRSVLLWPDNDAAGRKYHDDVIGKLRALGCTVEAIDVAALNLPDKGDCVDYFAAHPDATAADVFALPRLKNNQAEIKPSNAPRAVTVKQTAGNGTFASAPDPLPSPLPAVPAFDAALLPQSVRAWCIDAADGLQVPLDFTAIPAMVALAGAIGRRVGVAMKRNDHWHELPMLWGCVIGRPSSGKSPALSPARRMLERLANAERDDFERSMREHEARAMVAEASKANARDNIRKALKSGDKTGAEAAADAALFDDAPPTEPRIMVNDATVEKLGELLNANPRGLVQFRDELAGWLASLDREGRESDRAFWLECWNGSGGFIVDRIGRGTIRIDACAMSILGGMQPGKLAEYVRGAIRGGFSDDGLIQRFQLAVYPDLPASWSYSDRPLDPKAEATAWATFQRLRNLDPDAIGGMHADWLDVPFLRFNDEAQELLIEWQTALMHRLRAGDEPAWMESHLSKYRGLVGRLSLVLHLADNGRGSIPADTLATALDWCGYLEGHARRIYAPAMDNGLTAAHLILRRRADLGDAFTARDLYRRGWAGLSDPDAIAEGLELLADHRHLSARMEQTGGRPSMVYAWGANA